MSTADYFEDNEQFMFNSQQHFPVNKVGNICPAQFCLSQPIKRLGYTTELNRKRLNLESQNVANYIQLFSANKFLRDIKKSAVDYGIVDEEKEKLTLEDDEIVLSLDENTKGVNAKGDNEGVVSSSQINHKHSVMAADAEFANEPTELENELKVKPAEFENKPTELENEPTELENEPTELENEPTELENEPTELENEPTELENEPTELENEPAELENEPTELENEPTKLDDEFEKEFENEQTELENEPTELENERAEFENEFKNEAESTELEKNELQNEPENEPVELQKELIELRNDHHHYGIQDDVCVCVVPQHDIVVHIPKNEIESESTETHSVKVFEIPNGPALEEFNIDNKTSTDECYNTHVDTNCITPNNDEQSQVKDALNLNFLSSFPSIHSSACSTDFLFSFKDPLVTLSKSQLITTLSKEPRNEELPSILPSPLRPSQFVPQSGPPSKKIKLDTACLEECSNDTVNQALPTMETSESVLVHSSGRIHNNSGDHESNYTVHVSDKTTKSKKDIKTCTCNRESNNMHTTFDALEQNYMYSFNRQGKFCPNK